jgi:cell fate regulator YaaT (PSP1 superfamily)
MTSKIVGIRFQEAGKIYHFDASKAPDIQIDDFVIVETSRGQQLGQVTTFVTSEQVSGERHWKPILRKATPRDLVLRQVWEEKEQEALRICREKVNELNVPELKYLSAEYSLEGEKLVFLYCFEGKEEPPEQKEIEQAMRKAYPNTDVEMKRVGPRDAAKIIGGMGACGKGIRCCTEYMMEFEPISIKMAKVQSVSLAPSEITGMCGRLRCCLKYEHPLYKEAMRNLPKRGKRVRTPRGEGKVVRLSPLQNAISVDLGEAGIQEFSEEDVELI